MCGSSAAPRGLLQGRRSPGCVLHPCLPQLWPWSGGRAELRLQTWGARKETPPPEDLAWGDWGPLGNACSPRHPGGILPGPEGRGCALL